MTANGKTKQLAPWLLALGLACGAAQSRPVHQPSVAVVDLPYPSLIQAFVQSYADAGFKLGKVERREDWTKLAFTYTDSGHRFKKRGRAEFGIQAKLDGDNCAPCEIYYTTWGVIDSDYGAEDSAFQTLINQQVEAAQAALARRLAGHHKALSRPTTPHTCMPMPSLGQAPQNPPASRAAASECERTTNHSVSP